MSPTPGWYADPRDASRLRYWDGDAWTDNLAPQPAPPGAFPQPTDGVAHWSYPAAGPAQQQDWQYGAPVATQAGARTGSSGPRTPDGVPITSWLKRLAARVLDGLFVALLTLPFTGYFLYRYIQAAVDQMNDQTGITLVPSDEVLRWELPVALILLAGHAVYETVGLRLWSATPGKRVLGISIRLMTAPGRLGWSVIAKRVGFLFGVSLLSFVPVVSYVAGIVWLLDYLWPLWNKPRQALHDKVAATVVVEGPQQRESLLQS